MRYINQLQYRHVPYRTHVKMDVPETEKLRNVARSGCGLCSACMAVEQLTNYSLDVEDCVKLSEGCGANHGRGTDMEILGPVIAEHFGMDYRATDDLCEVIRHLQAGGRAIVRVGVPEGKEIGLFARWQHFMLLVSTDGEELCFMDPSYTADKYTIPERAGKVNTANAPFLYCNAEILHAETVTEHKKYYLFSRKKK